MVAGGHQLSEICHACTQPLAGDHRYRRRADINLPPQYNEYGFLNKHLPTRHGCDRLTMAEYPFVILFDFLLVTAR